MPIVIRAKVGTMPGGYLRVKSKRAVPKAGEAFWARTAYADGRFFIHGEKWFRLKMDDPTEEVKRVSRL